VEVSIFCGKEFIICASHNLFPGSARKTREFGIASEIDTGTILEEDTVGDGIQESGKKGRILGKSFGRVADIMTPLLRGASFKERFKGRWLARSHKYGAFLAIWIITLTEIGIATSSGRLEFDAFGLSCQAALRQKTMSNGAEKLNDFRRFILRKVAGSEVGKTCSPRPQCMYRQKAGAS
jgi:hypothetical protein